MQIVQEMLQVTDNVLLRRKKRVFEFVSVRTKQWELFSRPLLSEYLTKAEDIVYSVSGTKV